MGSWTFVGLFILFMAAWAAVNTFLLATRAWDPYPFILLNLVLSFQAAFTAPVLRDAARVAGVDMPVVEAVCALLEDAAPLAQVIDALLTRPLRPE